jgi:hypothetical protein
MLFHSLARVPDGQRRLPIPETERTHNLRQSAASLDLLPARTVFLRGGCAMVRPIVRPIFDSRLALTLVTPDTFPMII